jgi:hypothetical protein
MCLHSYIFWKIYYFFFLPRRNQAISSVSRYPVCKLTSSLNFLRDVLSFSIAGHDRMWRTSLKVAAEAKNRHINGLMARR